MKRFRLPIMLICGLCAGLAASRFLFLPLSGQGRASAELAITANIEAGTTFEVFINSDYDRTWKVNVVPGQKVRYVFKNVPEIINALRLDVTDVKDARVDLDGVEIVARDRAYGSIGGSVLGTWASNQLVSAPSDDGGPGYLTLGNDPFLHASGLQLSAAEAFAEGSWADLMVRNLTLVSVSLVSVFFFLAPIGWLVALPCVLILTASVTLAPLVAEFVLSNWSGELSARQAIGSAAFTGYDKAPEQLALLVTALLIAFLGGLLGVAWRRLSRPDAENQYSAELDESPRPFAFVSVAVVILLFAVTNFPQLVYARAAMTTAQQALYGYDWGNIFTWNFLSLYGFLPFRDYWFCYSGDWNQLGSDPAALWRVYLVQLTLFSALYVSLYEICGRRLVLPLLILLPIGWMALTGLSLGTRRYLVSVAVVLAAAAVTHARPRNLLPYVGFGVLIGWTFNREPLQLFYAAPGVLLLSANFLFDKSWDTPRLTRGIRLGVAAATGVLVIAVQVLFLYRHGQLAGFIDFYRHLSALSPAAAVPASLLRWYDLSAWQQNASVPYSR